MTTSTTAEGSDAAEAVPGAVPAPEPFPAAARTGQKRRDKDSAERMFSTSVMVSGIRCLIAYVLLPWVAPALGVGKGVGPQIGLGITVVAVAFNILSIRRFQRSGHRWRWVITAINLTVITLLLVLAVEDIAALV